MEWLDSVEHVTPEELAALAETLRNSARDATGKAEVSTRDEVVLRFDIVGATSVAPDGSMPALELAHDRFSTRIGILLERLTCIDVTSYAHEVEHVRFSDMLRQLPELCVAVLVELEGLGANGIVFIEPNVLVHVMDMLAGGRGGNDQQAIEQLGERGLTSSEQRLTYRFVRVLSQALTESWSEIAPISLRPVRTEIDPRRTLFIDPQEAVVRLPLQMDWGDVSGSVALLIPVSCLKPLEKRLSRSIVDSPLSKEASWANQFHAQIARVPVQIIGELGTAHITLRKLLQLNEGDVIRLDKDPDGEIVVRVEGMHKLDARATVSRGNLSLQLTGGPATLQEALVPTSAPPVEEATTPMGGPPTETALRGGGTTARPTRSPLATG